MNKLKQLTCIAALAAAQLRGETHYGFGTTFDSHYLSLGNQFAKSWVVHPDAYIARGRVKAAIYSTYDPSIPKRLSEANPRLEITLLNRENVSIDTTVKQIIAPQAGIYTQQAEAGITIRDSKQSLRANLWQDIHKYKTRAVISTYARNIHTQTLGNISASLAVSYSDKYYRPGTGFAAADMRLSKTKVLNTNTTLTISGGYQYTRAKDLPGGAYMQLNVGWKK